jgi:uncharacterized phage-associated protein
MPYPAAAIANEFLELAKANGQALTPMHIQKLIYFAHGWNLAITGEPLIWERVEPWDYGPVVRNLYRDLREFGSGAITKSLEEKSDYMLRTTPRIQGGDDPLFARDLVRKVWETYGHFSALELSEMTHVPDSPWSYARQVREQVISDERIREYFSRFIPQEQVEPEPKEA